MGHKRHGVDKYGFYIPDRHCAKCGKLVDRNEPHRHQNRKYYHLGCFDSLFIGGDD